MIINIIKRKNVISTAQMKMLSAKFTQPNSDFFHFCFNFTLKCYSDVLLTQLLFFWEKKIHLLSPQVTQADGIRLRILEASHIEK